MPCHHQEEHPMRSPNWSTLSIKQEVEI
ncbi:hypothetical protein JL09_g6822 [Pichia kudriavzevii]|uniref:Uncharacterized protein n=1 Tax=Pichia kudriavzevii TaxID=4909 RepID=A0A099NJ14_PICKU|nr:hypothetical protein JL09_g6823 [Pichia kudriavzevii]KGK32571.1 hypothetical protein JL09_g6822 [Pichia kudriavzevii]